MIKSEGYKGNDSDNIDSFSLSTDNGIVRVSYINGQSTFNIEDEVTVKGVYSGLDADRVTPNVVAREIQ